MANHNFNAFSESELECNLEKIKIAKHSCTFKLNILRDAATSSTTHLPTFDSLENRLFNAQHQIYEIETADKYRKKKKSNGLGLGYDDDDDENLYLLKKSMSMIGVFDSLAGDIARLKFVLEVPQPSAEPARGNAASAGGSRNPANLDERTRTAPSLSGYDNNGPSAKKQKSNPDGQASAPKKPKSSKGNKSRSLRRGRIGPLPDIIVLKL